MKKQKLLLVVTLFGAMSAGQAFAVDAGIAAEAGTTGLGLRLTLPVTERINARIGFGALSYSDSRNIDDVEYDAKLKLNTIDALLDFYPVAQSGFRVTGGVAYNGNEVDVTARPNSNANYVFNNVSYNAALAGTVDGRVDFRKTAPYLGIGWGNAIEQGAGWKFTSDLGVLFQGSPRTSLTSNNCQFGAALCAQLAGDLAAENAELRDKADSFKYFPVVRIGVSYRF
jgi:hypothetical protein